jgi:hypothetical protein
MMMPRIRSVKPELFTHEGLFELEMQYQLPLRLAYIALFSCCDREGRFRWQPARLKLHMLPYDKVDVTQVLNIFFQRGYIQKYKYQGEFYGCIPSWSRHQKIRKEAKSTLPSIEEAEGINFNSNDEIAIKTCSVEDPPLVPETEEDFKKVLWETTVDFKKTPSPEGKEGKGREGKGKEGKGSIVAPEARPHSVFETGSVFKIFEHWQMVMKHPNAKLDPKRKVCIGKALSWGYSVEQLCQAITGCSLTPHNQGKNDRGQRYDGLCLILRDSDQIDRFIDNFHCPPRVQTEANRKTEANVQSLQRWMDQKMKEEEKNANAR